MMQWDDSIWKTPRLGFCLVLPPLSNFYFLFLLVALTFSSFELDLLGATLRLSGTLMSYLDEWLLAAAGPFVNIVSSIALLPLCMRLQGVAKDHLTFFIIASLSLAFLNLLPIKSFDGGRMCSAVVSHFGSPRMSDRILMTTTFLSLFVLWSLSLYMMLRVGGELSLFFFSAGLFVRIFIQNENWDFARFCENTKELFRLFVIFAE